MRIDLVKIHIPMALILADCALRNLPARKFAFYKKKIVPGMNIQLADNDPED